MRRGVAWLLMLALLLVNLSANAETLIDLMHSRYGVSEQVAVVTVDADAVNTVRSGIFGANTSYIGGGHIYNKKTLAFNPKLVQGLRDSGVTSIRLPGGIEGDYFHWYETVGPVEDRLPQINCFSEGYPVFSDEAGAPYDVLFGPDEWIALCNMTGTKLTIQLNTGNGTPQEAVDFIRYCLASDVAIDDITVGNEVCMDGDMVEGITIAKTPRQYVDFYLQVYDLMGEELRQELKARGIPFGCIGIPMSHALNAHRDWDKIILKELNGKTDFIDVHIAYAPYFADGDTNEQIVKCLLGSGDRVRKHLEVELSSIKRYAPDVNIAISEHGPLGGQPYSAGMAGGMFLASFFHVVLAEPKVISADYLPLTNHPAANTLLGYYNENGEDVTWDNVVSMVFRMYADQIGRDVLATQVTGAKTFTAPAVGLMPATRGVSDGDAAVYFNRENGEGTLFILNKAYKENTTFDITLPFGTVEITSVTELFAPNHTMYNDWRRPALVQPATYSEHCGWLESGRLTITTKPVSLVRIDFMVPAVQ